MKMENTIVLLTDDVVHPPFVLTRYLYNKDDVLASLFLSILDKDYLQAVFWTCELYVSGWKQEVAEYLMAIYQECFEQQNPRLGRFLKRQYSNIVRDLTIDSCHLAATMARNLADPSRKYCIAAFVNCTSNIRPTKESNIYVIVDTCVDTYVKPVLETVCKYKTRKDFRQFLEYESEDEICNSILHRDNWLYFASFSPIWSERIAKHQGIVNHEKQTIEFVDEDEEQFNEKYDYEFDEQSLEVQDRLRMTDARSQVQMTKPDFIQKYGYNNKYAFDIVEVKRNIKRIRLGITQHTSSVCAKV